jgi:putative PIN family toxin of toxin-antitoxin system
LVSALISVAGTPARLLLGARHGGFELIVSPLLLTELETVLRRDKFRRYCDLTVVKDYIERLRHEATVALDPEGPGPLRAADPADDYLIALAHSQNAILVSGDKHLLDLIGGGAPILTPGDLLAAVS